MLVACSACIVLVVYGVEDGVGVWICVSMLSQRWVHTDGVESAGECLMEEAFHYCPSFQIDRMGRNNVHH